MGLSVLGVALGVALVVSIDVANQSAKRAFQLSAEGVTGKATHRIIGPDNRLDEKVYSSLKVSGQLSEAAPVIEAYGRVPGEAGRTLRIMGVDPVAEAPFRSFSSVDAGIDLSLFITRPGAALLARSTVEALGVSLNDSFRVAFGGRPYPFVLVGILESSDERSEKALTDLLVTDVSSAQEALQLSGYLSYVDLMLEDEADQERVASQLPDGIQLVRSATRTNTLEQMTRAFELNLTSLSLLALIVGVFLVYNTMTFSVVVRRNLMGRLRTLGVTRRQVFNLILGEALLIGVAGTVIGVALGLVLGRILMHLVTQSINDLYYVLTVRDVAVTGFTLAKGIILGIGATLLAAMVPAREAMHSQPGTVLRRSNEELAFRGKMGRLALFGVISAVFSILLFLIPGRSILISYGGLFFVMVAFAFLTPLIVDRMAQGLRGLMGGIFGVIGRMATGGIRASLSRSSVAVAALLVAVAATIGVGVMVDSFRKTVVVWLDQTLQADLYVSAPSLSIRRADTNLDASFVDAVMAWDGYEAISSGSGFVIQSSVGTIDVVAFDLAEPSYKAFQFKEGDATSIWARWGLHDEVIVSEPFSFRHGVGLGDQVVLQTDRGSQYFEIIGVHYDYGSDLGTLIIDRTVFNRYFDDRSTGTLGVFLPEGLPLEQGVTAIQELIPEGQDVVISANQVLRDTSLEVFDRTFTITLVLRLLAIGVAFIGVLSALMALQMERARELAVLRATGLTPRQLWQYVTLQTGLMGFFAGLLALPLGVLLAAILVFITNRRSFGWTLQFEVAPEMLWQALALALVAAILAGIYPAWRMSRANPAHAMREE